MQLIFWDTKIIMINKWQGVDFDKYISLRKQQILESKNKNNE